MSASADELLTIFKRWKKDGNKLTIDFSQNGQTRLATVNAWVEDASEEKVTFGFGLKIAGGTFDLWLSSGVFFARVVNPVTENVESLESWDTAVESCIEFRWMSVSDRCVICAFPK